VFLRLGIANARVGKKGGGGIGILIAKERIQRAGENQRPRCVCVLVYMRGKKGFQLRGREERQMGERKGN
jgi:hypothetical protein